MGMALAQFSTSAVWSHADRELTSGANIWGASGISSSARANTYVNNTVLATTGDLAAGEYEFEVQMQVEGNAESVALQHLTNADAVSRTLASLVGTGSVADKVFTWKFRLTLTINEEVRVIVTNHTGGLFSQATLTWAKRNE